MSEPCCIAPTPGVSMHFDMVRSLYVQSLVCMLCRAPLPLSPANDDDPRVAVEKRAAELAQSGAVIVDHELLGWRSANCGEFPQNDRNELAGYLARCIATHDQEQEG